MICEILEPGLRVKGFRVLGFSVLGFQSLGLLGLQGFRDLGLRG